MESDIALFRRRLLRNPRQISAIAPSSRTLARAMTLGIGPGSGKVVEFGPGTGRFTEALLARGLPPENLSLFELDDEFVPYLRRRFPGVAVHRAGAETAPDVVEGEVQTVISGLPLLSFPKALQEAILSGAFRMLGPRGTLVQFTYGPRPPVPDAMIEALGLKVNKGHKVWANLPPARVYRFRRS
ncbi:class I SAM-dependent methyltransferase [Pseudogemmobacter sonorensis]|uniref:class I SAM-dependent methyltransferase n=1 Tax=Pseudogemmobacter sonorensis TaxID=2989681 RepID=UPI00369F3FBE